MAYPPNAALRASRRLAFSNPRLLALTLGLVALTAILAAPAAHGQSLADFEARTTVHTLDNGWTFLIVERPGVPVFSFATVVDVGGAQEVPGITGLAHMFEHMAFKGTPVVGTTDYESEQETLAEVERRYQAYQAERLSRDPDPDELARLLAAFEEAQEAAGQFVVANEFSELVEIEGGVGLNAFTGSDLTGYLYSLPANKLELWAYLESERFLHPVYREFYKERSVVQEERRLRTDSQPVGRLIEQWLAAAFTAHPYGQPVVGYMSDLESITVTDAEEFFETYYAPANMVTALVGDLDPERVIPLVETYFGRIPARPAPKPLRTVEPEQISERRVILRDSAQPFYLESYHRPAETHPDQAVYEAIDDIMSRGRTSRLYRRLVQDEQLAVAVQSFSGFPGTKYPNLWAVLAVPARGVSNERIETVIREELDRLIEEGVTEAELERFRTRAKADLIRGLDSNLGMAIELADTHRIHGDWRELFRSIERLEDVTSEDVRRVARETFEPEKRTVAVIETVPPSPTSGDDAPTSNP